MAAKFQGSNSIKLTIFSLGRVERRAKRFDEAREVRVKFYEAMDAFTPKIESAEKLLEGLVVEGIGKSSKHNLKQQLDMMEVRNNCMRNATSKIQTIAGTRQKCSDGVRENSGNGG